MPPTPEALACKNIDDQLTAAGWTMQDRAGMKLYARRGVGVREFPVEGGFADYMLFADRKAIRVVEAKKGATVAVKVTDMLGEEVIVVKETK